jgi:signal transduction histidine kinase
VLEAVEARPRRNATNAPLTEDSQFARLVMLACHDLRTPLATVHGFAQTLVRMESLDETTVRYLEMIDSASAQIAELIDKLSLGARIEAGRYDPLLASANTIELARAAAEELGTDRVAVAGEGAEIEVDVVATQRALASLAQCALRHGGQERVELTVHGEELGLAPITPASAPVVLGEELRDLGAAIAVRLIKAQGGSVALDGEMLRLRLV